MVSVGGWTLVSCGADGVVGNIEVLSRAKMWLMPTLWVPCVCGFAPPQLRNCLMTARGRVDSRPLRAAHQNQLRH